MSVASRLAERVRRRYRLGCIITEADIDGVLSGERLMLIEVGADFPVPEFREGRAIGIRAGQSESWRKWYKAHALGHCLLHRGDQFKDPDGVVTAKQERQADLFAGWLLLAHAWQGETPDEIAEKCGVPQECAQKWAEEVRSTGEIAVGW